MAARLRAFAHRLRAFQPRRQAWVDLNRIFAIDLSISVKECTQEWLREVEIGP